MRFIEQGEVVSGPYVPIDGRGVRYYRAPLTGRLVTLIWHSGGLTIGTRYDDGKPYRFTITKNGGVQWVKW